VNLALFEDGFGGQKKNNNSQIDIMHLFSADPTTFSKKLNICFAPKNMKKTSSKVAHNRPKLFFSLLPIVPKPAQITFSVSYKCLPSRLLYNDFDYAESPFKFFFIGFFTVGRKQFSTSLIYKQFEFFF